LNRSRVPTVLILAALFLAALSLLAASFSVEVGGAEWETAVLANDTVGFAQVAAGKQVHVVARTESGLEHWTREGALRELGLRSDFKAREISDRESAGSYASLETVSGVPMVAYQYAEVGSERVRLAEWNGSDWSISSVTGERGLNAGMHTELSSVAGKPVVLYTDDADEDLTAATKTESGWSKRDLESGSGAFTDAESCGDTAKLAYSTRGNYTVRIGTLSQESWSSRTLNLSATSLDLAVGNGCSVFLAGYSGDRNNVFVWNGSTTRVDGSLFSRVSAGYTDTDFQVLYGEKNSGVRIGSPSSGYTKLGGSRAQYNDVAFQNGNRYAAYTNGSELVFAEHNTEIPENRGLVLKVIRALLAAAAILAAAGIVYSSDNVRDRARDLVPGRLRTTP
jgi:hypothetical protein